MTNGTESGNPRIGASIDYERKVGEFFLDLAARSALSPQEYSIHRALLKGDSELPMDDLDGIALIAETHRKIVQMHLSEDLMVEILQKHKSPWAQVDRSLIRIGIGSAMVIYLENTDGITELLDVALTKLFNGIGDIIAAAANAESQKRKAFGANIGQ